MVARKSSALIVTDALLLRRVDYGEADLVITLLTKQLGKLSALARGARKSARRFGGALEPMHTLRVTLDERPNAELFVLTEAKLERVRTKIMDSLPRLEAAGKALSWARRAAPPRTPEPEPYAVLEKLLDRLADADAETSARMALAEAGLSLLVALGWGIDLERCVRCGRQAAENQSASVDAARGGLICRSCGGARVRVSAETRRRLGQAAQGQVGVLSEPESAVALGLVEVALGAHAGID